MASGTPTSSLRPADRRTGTPRIGFAEAKSKISDPYSGLKLLSVVHHISLPPRFLHNIRAGIREQLNAHINVYNESANGVLVAYSNMKAMQQTGAILADEPFIHFKVRADAIYFQPQSGELLRATVNKLGRDHIGCLVHQCFNAALDKPAGGCDVRVGDEVVFEVLQTSPHAGLLAINGRLVQDESSTKRKRTDSSSLATTPEARQQKRAKLDRSLDLSRSFNQEPVAGPDVPENLDTGTQDKHQDLDSTRTDSMNMANDIAPDDSVELSSKKRKKSKKKKSENELDPMDTTQSESFSVPSKPKKRKKSKGDCSNTDNKDVSTIDAENNISSSEKNGNDLSSNFDRSQNESTEDAHSVKKKKKKKSKHRESGEVNEEAVGGENGPVGNLSPGSVDSAIGSLSNGLEMNLKLELSESSVAEDVSSAKKKKKKKSKEAVD